MKCITEGSISLHGLGFLQAKLEGNQRIHVWHPDLPRRKCFEHSNIHNHRFGFDSHVLIGRQINRRYDVIGMDDNTHAAYSHEGDRSEFGNRPWIDDFHVGILKESELEIIMPGQIYTMLPYDYHSTECDGIVVTLMKKTIVLRSAAHSLCTIGVEPDVDFDRFQLSDNDMWEFFNDAMCHANKN